MRIIKFYFIWEVMKYKIRVIMFMFWDDEVKDESYSIWDNEIKDEDYSIWSNEIENDNLNY